MADVVGIGSAFVDYFFETDEQFLNKLDLKPEDDFLFKEKKINPREIIKNLPLLEKSPGGITTNTLSVLSRLNVSVGYVGVIGNGVDGDHWMDNIGPIDKSQIVRIGKMSFCDCILTHKRKHRTFLSKVNSKDNDFILDYGYVNSAKIFHISSLILDARKGIKITKSILPKISGPLISFSPSIFYITEGRETLLPILNRTEILFLNKKEMKYLQNHNPQKGSKTLIKYGVKIVVCTLGNRGSIITTEAEQFFVPRVNTENIVDTTGAGDTFAAGFLYGLLKNMSLRNSAEFASKLAAASLGNYGLKWLKDYDPNN